MYDMRCECVEGEADGPGRGKGRALAGLIHAGSFWPCAFMPVLLHSGIESSAPKRFLHRAFSGAQFPLLSPRQIHPPLRSCHPPPVACARLS